ncbi:MAG: hypothetical protein ACP6IQ_01870 [Candidatus Njordarchaeia archaeon]
MNKYEGICELINQYYKEEKLNDLLPHGSGFDCDWSLEYEQGDDTPILVGAFHPVNEVGFYLDWVHFKIGVIPLKDGFDITFYRFYPGTELQEEDIDMLKDYILETVYWRLEDALEREEAKLSQNKEGVENQSL